MKFKIDENLPIEIADLLRDAGYEAETVADESLVGHDDSEIARACFNEGRILITLDKDFSDIRVYDPKDFPGIIVLRLKRQDKRHVFEVASKLILRFESKKPSRNIWIVDEIRIRIRG